MSQVSGAWSVVIHGESVRGVNTGSTMTYAYYDMNASRCSSVYSGTGNDLNPLSRTCKFFIRY